MKLQNPNVPDWTVEVTDKEEIRSHLAAGWQEMTTKRRATKKVESANAAKAVNESPSAKTEGDKPNSN